MYLPLVGVAATADAQAPIASRETKKRFIKSPDTRRFGWRLTHPVGPAQAKRVKVFNLALGPWPARDDLRAEGGIMGIDPREHLSHGT
jgi:hypothetical protein